MKALLDLNFIIPISIACFWAIIFIQSGMDKVLDLKGNVDWLKGHFAKTFIGKFTGPLVIVIAIFELIAGGSSLIGLGVFLVNGSTKFIIAGVVVSIISLLMLIFGQRLAKDYEGAKTIAIYFGIALLSAYLLS
ncbi:DoxX family protein [bacterium]|nr:DoxX family protein [bacterium]